MSPIDTDTALEPKSDSHRTAPCSPSDLVLYDKCMEVANNLWWAWHPDVINLFRDLDPIRWRRLDHNPIALLREFTPERLAVRRRNGALQPHQPRISATEGVHDCIAHVGHNEHRGAGR